MTKRDFEMIAEAIRDAKDDVAVRTGASPLESAAVFIADGCKADNPRFDRSRFLRACGFDA